ncbi:MAG: carboxymuconolactone decarboxylase family protein [Planctomycetota bacterium]
MLKLAAAALIGAGTVFAATTATGPAAPKFQTERGFVIHDQASAPAETREVLDWYVDNVGFVPNLGGIMAESPALSRSYWQLQVNLQNDNSLSPPEDNIVQMAIAVANECQYCTAGHTMAGRMFFRAPEAQLQALRKQSALPEAKFNALRDFALAVHETRGQVSESHLRDFYEAGYTRRNALDVVANVASKVMSNYTNWIAQTPIDAPLKPLAEGLPFAEDYRAVPVTH